MCSWNLLCKVYVYVADESRVLLARDSCQSSDSNYICATSVDVGAN